ncbi:MAG: hypothetical protein QI223_08110 [Candidatus Korarchaeota archaeon]|nr:hypothetical protein [Candidatus Korarchaeota archaeon]
MSRTSRRGRKKIQTTFYLDPDVYSWVDSGRRIYGTINRFLRVLMHVHPDPGGEDLLRLLPEVFGEEGAG